MVRDPHSLSFLATGGQVTGDYIQPYSQAVLGTKLGSHKVTSRTLKARKHYKQLVDGLGTRLSATGSDHFKHSMSLCSLNFFLICDVVIS